MPCLRSVLAAVALVGQLLLGSLVPPDGTTAGATARAADATARLHAVTILCSSRPAAPATPAHPRHRPADPAACPLEIGLALPAVILMPAVAVPSPAMAARRAPFILPAARAPPATTAWARRARGPPGPA